ncbi:MAG: hypothetical protein AAGU23_11455 [Bacillota bacterium]
MHKKVKYFLAASLLMFVPVAAGCGASQTATPAQNAVSSGQTAANMPKEDPNVFIKEMRQTLATITEQSKLNKLGDAKKATSDLASLQEKLAVHITDAKQRDSLRQGITDLQAEVQKPSPSQASIDKQVEIVKSQLNNLSGQMQSHKHN